VIAHTVGWDYTNVEAIPDFAAGRLPAFFARYDADWGSINAELVARYRVEDWDALMQTLRDAQAAFVAALSDLNDTDLDRRASWNGRRVSLRGMLRAISRDEAEHVRQIEAFLRP
ncbi:MAG TPA: DinB family protein, partial [Dehalococcoidia bacterium]|nr:DinB family protein [Dehalococcoidia bacterium]